MSKKQRTKIIVVGLIGIFLLSAAVWLDWSRSYPAASVFRNLLPALLMVLAYWQSGNFYIEANKKLQQRLLDLDQKLFSICNPFYSKTRWKGWINHYLEFAYLFCYPMVPAGIALLYFLKLEQQAPLFWMIVIPPSFFCYAMVAFIQTLPPRTLEEKVDAEHSEFTIIRSLNLRIIKHGSIQINTFPSAHAAASIAVALALIRIAPAAGWIFLWIAVSVAIAAAVCRYHFAADVIIGAAAALFWFLIFSAVR